MCAPAGAGKTVAWASLVSLAVAVILYDSGLALEWGKVRGRARRVVPRLVIWGVPITMAFAALLAGRLLGMSAGPGLMTGAILVVSGPTVVGPLLAFVRLRRANPAARSAGACNTPAAGTLRPETSSESSPDDPHAKAPIRIYAVDQG